MKPNLRLLRVLWSVVSVCCLIDYCKTSEEYCYFDDKDPYVQFGSKSAYELVRAQKHQYIPTCTPVIVWASIRHGTEYPSKQTMDLMKTLLDVRDQIVRNHEENKEGELCLKDLENLKNWTYLLSPFYEKTLSRQGKDDLGFLAKRLKSQFSNIFDVYSREKFAFYNDGTTRTVESTEAFVAGLFGTDTPISSVYENSSLLKSPETCSSWVNQVKHNSDSTKEFLLFRQSDHIRNLISEVNHRLGFRNNLTLDVIELMYDTCRYEKAWYIGSKPQFCSVFSKRNLQILEYMEDIKFYHLYGYGNHLNKRLACPLISDMLNRFKVVAEGKSKSGAKPVGVFYFSHTGIHIPSLTFLNIKEDTLSLLHSNFESSSRREFMTSMIDPFSANLVAVFYKCISGEENRVMFYLNEHVVRYPGCDVGMCSWSFLKNKFGEYAEHNSCDFDFCTTGRSDRIIPTFSWMLSVTVLVVIVSS